MSDMQKAGPHHGTGPLENPTDDEYTAHERHSGTQRLSANPVVVPANPEVWAALGGAYAVVVTRPGGRSRRRLYFGLASAQRVVDRAQARGEHAHLALVRLIPCGEVTQ